MEYQYCSWGNVLGLHYLDGRSSCVFYLFPFPFVFPSLEYKNLFPININYLRPNKTGFSGENNVKCALVKSALSCLLVFKS